MIFPGLLQQIKNLSKDPNFIIQVKTDNTGDSADDQIMLPIQGTDMVIDWGDGNVETVTQANVPNATLVDGNNVVHTYDFAGTYDIKIGPTIERVLFIGDKLKPLNVKNWGEAVWGNLSWAFNFCNNLIVTASDSPNLTECSILAGMLRNTSVATVSFNDWDVSNIINFNQTFNLCDDLDVGVSSWDTSSGQTFQSMFERAYAFKEDLSAWNFEAATNLTSFLASIDINETGTTTNYDALLNSINSQNVNTGLSFHGGTSKYSSAGETSRWQLIAVHLSANADASGTDKSVHDAEAAGFQFWDTAEEKIYIKKAATSGAWIGPLNLGKSWTIVDGGLA